MNWSDERYVKLYTRQTATWRMWPWQARCVFPLLLQVSDGAGLIDVGARDPITALAVLVMVPREVVEAGVSALLEDGTLEVVSAGYLVPKFLEAQEATKTERLKKADQRAGRRAQAREIPRVDVPTCPEVSRLVPPSPAQPTTSPAQPIKTAPPKTATPRESDLLVADFKELVGEAYVFSPGKDGPALAALRKHSTIEAISARWRLGLKATGWLGVRTIAQLNSKWNDLAAPVAPKPGGVAQPSLWTTTQPTTTVTEGL